MVELVCYKNSERIITMDNTNYTTEHRKGQHLLNEERYEIEVRLKDGWSIYKIDVYKRQYIKLHNCFIHFSQLGMIG